MKKRIWRRPVPAVLLLLAGLLTMFPVSANDQIEPINNCMAIQTGNFAASSGFAAEIGTDELLTAQAPLSAEELENIKLYPGGMPFGVRFMTDGVTVVGFSDIDVDGKKINPALSAGVKRGDVILRVDGTPLESAADLTERIEEGNGAAITLLCRRGKKEIEIRIKPAFCAAENRYKTGIWVRDSGAGIGTVTFLLPESGAFAGLGHGICDADSGEPIPIRRGSVSDVTISSVVKGTPGDPGELKGYFNPGKVGSLLGNSSYGVWGVYSELPALSCEPMSVAPKDEVQDGDATILCTLADNITREYTVRLSAVNPASEGAKCFTVTVTDPRLLSETGGIVQGMSGSPVLQNGTLVGAVTHVLVNDPTTGYGIFLENMLARMPVVREG